MLTAVKKMLMKLAGSDYVLEFVASVVGRGIDKIRGRIEADSVMYELGKKIREKIPGDTVELHIGHLVGFFKAGLLGKDKPEYEPIEEELEIDTKN